MTFNFEINILSDYINFKVKCSLGSLAAHSAYEMFSWYKYLIVSLFFSHLGFWSGNLFLIAPFPDLCLLVPFDIFKGTMDKYHSTAAKDSSNKDRKILCVGVVVTIIVGFVIGILIGRFVTCLDEKPEARSSVVLDAEDQTIMQDGDQEISNILINGVKSENIRENLRLVELYYINIRIPDQ